MSDQAKSNPISPKPINKNIKFSNVSDKLL